MSFKTLGQSYIVNVTSAGVSQEIPLNAPVARIYNKGPNDCTFSLTRGPGSATDADIPQPAGLLETHDKPGADYINLKTAVGETAQVKITPGIGD